MDIVSSAMDANDVNNFMRKWFFVTASAFSQWLQIDSMLGLERGEFSLYTVIIRPFYRLVPFK